MPSRSLLPFLSFLLLGMFSVSPALSQKTRHQDGLTFSVSVDLVKIPVSVFDEEGAMVQTLRRRDFILYEDGVRQNIRSFGVDLKPVSVVLLIDTSATVEKELKKIKEAAEGFADALSEEDRVCVITFADEVEVAVDWTNETKKVGKALKKVEPGLRTDLYDAMYMAGRQLQGIEGRKAIIMLTDGLNNQSSIGWHDAVRCVVQSQASLYVVSKTEMVREAARNTRRVIMLSNIYKRLFGENYLDEYFEKMEAAMSALAEDTGGRCFFPTDYDRIKESYDQVARELKSKYYLTYISDRPKARNSFHKVQLDYLRPSSKLIYRKGYYFQPDPIPAPRFRR